MSCIRVPRIEDPAEQRILLRIKDYAYTYPDASAPVFAGVDMEIRQGECHCLLGPTGSGKTTLALAIKGLLPQGRHTGTVSSGSGRCRVGLVLQNPETQLLTDSVGAEVAFALENHCIPAEHMHDRVHTALAAADLGRPLDCPVSGLSMGQKYRLLIAAALVMEPDLLVLDEPSAQLDPQGLEHLLIVLQRCRRRGGAVLLCEHRFRLVSSVVDHCWNLEPGGPLRPRALQFPPPRADPIPVRRPVPVRRSVARASDQAPAPPVAVKGLTVAGADGSPLGAALSFTLRRGEVAAICGPNGVGKTSLLRCLMGFLPPLAGQVRIWGEQPDPRRLRGRVGCLLQNPASQLFASSVADEVAFTASRLSRPGKVAQRARESLELCGILEWADASPHKLSYGQKHLVALAAVLAGGPSLLLLDDPFAGLDDGRREALHHLLLYLSERRGITVVWTSHDPHLSTDGVQQIIRLEPAHA